jgi:hypothetical protein
MLNSPSCLEPARLRFVVSFSGVTFSVSRSSMPAVAKEGLKKDAVEGACNK